MSEHFFRKSFSVDELPALAREFLAFFSDKRIFLFEGDLGAGKTTFIKQLILELGSPDTGGSPSFGLIHEYEGTYNRIYHMDLYRVRKPEELDELGIYEYLDSGEYCFIEWPEKVMERLPSGEAVLVKLEYLAENLRCIHAS
jgi:tRNA threonylcarbamoyladenosine biosynthesis protein TsaE